MNKLNVELASIRRQKSIYKKILEIADEPAQIKKLKEKIKILQEEEYRLLRESGVKI